MSREIIFILIDFFLANNSPYSKSTEKRLELGSKNVIPAFGHLIATIANISKYCYTDKWDEEKENIGVNPPYYSKGKVIN